MSDVLSSDDLDALAAEYVLGTLDIEERKGAIALLEVDHAFRGTVRIWERRLSELHLMVEPVEPDAKILERIKAKLGHVPQIPISEEAPLPLPVEPGAAGETKPTEGETGEAKPTEGETGEAKQAEGETGEAKPAEGEAAEPKPPEAAGAAPAIVEVAWPEGEPKPPTLVPEEGTTQPEEPPARPPEPPPRPAVAPPSRRGAAVAEAPKRAGASRGWKISTVLTTLIALALAALIGAWRFYPERLPPQLRATTVLQLPEPPPPPLPPPRRPPPPPFDE